MVHLSSIFLAQLMGLFALGMGFSMFLKREMLLGVFHEIAERRALSYILGVLIFLIGLLLVLAHTVWELWAPLLMTLLGWGILLEGAGFLFFSPPTMRRYLLSMDHTRLYYGIAGAYVVVGASLTVWGFGA